MLNVEKLSTSYQVRKLTVQDANKAFALVQSNPTYFSYCPPQATRHSILEDMKVVPANKTLDDKYYVGFFKDNDLIAILDLVTSYPDDKSAWMGFFMVDAKYQGKGIGSSIMSDVLSAVENSGISRIELSYAKGNVQSEQFLLKNGFVKDGREIPVPGYTVVVMEQNLAGMV